MIEADKHLPNVNCNLEKPFLEIKMDTAIKNMKFKSVSGID